MIVLTVLLLVTLAEPPRYQIFGFSANSADELAEQVFTAPTLIVEEGTKEWRVRSNGRDIIWSVAIPSPTKPHAAVCRHITTRNGQTAIDMEIACDGTDKACDKVRDDFVALNEQMRRSLMGK